MALIIKFQCSLLIETYHNKSFNRRRVHTISDERKLRQKFDPSNLPFELGGSAGPVCELGEAWRAEVCRNKERLARLDSLLDLDEGGVEKVEEAREEAQAKASSVPALW